MVTPEKPLFITYGIIFYQTFSPLSSCKCLEVMKYILDHPVKTAQTMINSCIMCTGLPLQCLSQNYALAFTTEKQDFDRNFSLSASLCHNTDYLPCSLEANGTKIRTRETVGFCF